MIRDHKLHAERFAKLCLGMRGDAVIHCHDQSDAFLGKVYYAAFMHAVAFARTLRNIIRNVRAERGERAVQNCRCADAVDIIVAVNADCFPRRNRPLNALCGKFHVQQHCRPGQRLLLWMQEFLCLFLASDAAPVQDFRKRFGAAQRRPQRFHGGRIQRFPIFCNPFHIGLGQRTLKAGSRSADRGAAPVR